MSLPIGYELVLMKRSEMAWKATPEEAQKQVDDLMTLDASGDTAVDNKFGMLQVRKIVSVSYSEDGEGSGRYYVALKSFIDLMIPFCGFLPDIVVMKSKLRQDQIEFLERKRRETSQKADS